MTNWSIENLDNGEYGLVVTEGKQSRTAFLAFRYSDALAFVSAMETVALLGRGMPVEAFKVEPEAKPARKKPGRSRT